MEANIPVEKTGLTLRMEDEKYEKQNAQMLNDSRQNESTMANSNNLNEFTDSESDDETRHNVETVLSMLEKSTLDSPKQVSTPKRLVSQWSFLLGSFITLLFSEFQRK